MDLGEKKISAASLCCWKSPKYSPHTVWPAGGIFDNSNSHTKATIVLRKASHGNRDQGEGRHFLILSGCYNTGGAKVRAMQAPLIKTLQDKQHIRALMNTNG